MLSRCGFTVHPALRPAAWIYGLGVRWRNWCFDRGLRKTYRIPTASICVGNLTVGGTGKTPHTEYLIRLLHKQWRVTVFSRGYRRKTCNNITAQPGMTADDIGDEPWQMKHKYPDIGMTVCHRRAPAIQAAMQLPPDRRPQTVILDDAFQHRQVSAGLNILLTDYNRLICDDLLLPAGRMREPFSGRKRAHIVIVTKCPDQLSAPEQADIAQRLQLSPQQQLFFTRQRYTDLRPVFDEGTHRSIPLDSLRDLPSVLLVTGIATPQILARDFARYNSRATLMGYADHHNFTPSDQRDINATFARIRQKGSILVTTEKDAARLRLCKQLDAEVHRSLYALPLEVEFLNNEGNKFNQTINDYVRKSQRNF